MMHVAVRVEHAIHVKYRWRGWVCGVRRSVKCAMFCYPKTWASRPCLLTMFRWIGRSFFI